MRTGKTSEYSATIGKKRKSLWKRGKCACICYKNLCLFSPPYFVFIIIAAMLNNSWQGPWIQFCNNTFKRMVHINVGLNSPVISEEKIFRENLKQMDDVTVTK